MRPALGQSGIANALPYDMALATCFATRVEKRRTLPGDTIVPEPLFSVTHAITIGAPVERVWPWLAQMGSDRAGWYSWDAIDNGASEARAKDAFVVDPPHDLVLTAPDGDGCEAHSTPLPRSHKGSSR